jgi:hypothetical protein
MSAYFMHALHSIGAAYVAHPDRDRGLAMLQDSLRRALAMELSHDACRAYFNLGELDWLGGGWAAALARRQGLRLWMGSGLISTRGWFGEFRWAAVSGRGRSI